MAYCKSISGIVVVAALSLAGVAQADGAAIGEKHCAACHGSDGNSRYAAVPNIAGLSAEYLYDELRDFAKGERHGERFKPENGEERDMNEISKALSREEMQQVAEYYSRQIFKPRPQQFDPSLAKLGKKVYRKRCERCHEDNGREFDEDMGRLAGQPKQYLEKALRDFLQKKRRPPKKMAKQLKKLKENEIPALVHFFAAQQG